MIKSLKSEKKIKKIFDNGLTIKQEALSLRFYNFKDNEKLFGVSVPKKTLNKRLKEIF